MLTKDQKRLLIVMKAYSQVLVGSHYLTGTDSAVPGGKGMDSYRNLELKEDLEIDNFAIHAAKNEYGICPGRYNRKSRSKKFSSGDADLQAYLDGLKGSYLPSEQWTDFNNTGLYPRLAYGEMVLGEDCRNKRHFDCESLITWVLVEVLNKDKGIWRKGVDWFQDGGGGRLDVFKRIGLSFKNDKGKVIKKGDILNGDILISKPSSSGGEHIAFACEKGFAVIEASGRREGVISSEFKEKDWTDLARIKKI